MACHSERSEESLWATRRFFAALRMTGLMLSLHGTLHIVFAYVIILSLACGCFALARRFAIEPRWRGWAVYSVLSGVLILVFFALFLYTGLIPGFVERLSAGSHALWSFLLVATLFFQKRQGKDHKTKT